MKLLATRDGRARTTDEPPPRVIEILRQGLRDEPEARHPSMRALLTALQVAAGMSWPGRRARRIAAVAALLVLAGAGAGARVAYGPLSGACGDGVVAGKEECDDGNTVDGDRCLSDCRLATCGDRVVRATTEECDDGNQRNGDGCTTTCRRCDGPGRFFFPALGRCYVLHRTPTDWETARRTCAQQGSVLVTYEEAVEVIAVVRAFREQSVWIGLRRQEATGAYRWLTGEPLLPTLDGFWHGKLTAGGDLGCVRQISTKVRYQNRAVPASWVASACEERHAFVCEDVNWQVNPNTGHAYRFFFDEQTWDGARRACERHGGYLATFTNDQELEFVSRRNLFDAWMGATDIEHEGSVRWITGEPFAFQRFVPGELTAPSAVRADCMALGHSRLWHDRLCTQENYYVCEIDR